MKTCALFVLAIFFCMVAPSADAQSLWQWQYPVPQGNTLHDVDILAPNSAIAVGELGTVLKSTDAGLTWTLSPALAGVPNLNGVSFVDVTTVVAVGPAGLIVRSTNGGFTWSTQISGATNSLHDVDFGDASYGFAVGYDGTILQSSDGGATWTPQTSGTTATLHGVCAVDANTATVVGTGGTILRTLDGGSTWTPQSSGVTLRLYDVDFLDASTGTAVGIGPTAIATTDGGATWTPQPIPDPMLPPDFIELRSVHMRNASRTNIVGIYDAGLALMLELTGLLLQTTDGGTNWSQTTELGHLLGVRMFDNNVGVAVGAAGMIRRTTDGGLTWPQVAGGLQAFSMQGVDFFDAQHGVAVANETRVNLPTGRAYTTNDGGASWTITGPFPASDLFDVAFADANTVYVVGNGPRQFDSGAIIYKSTDAGMNWTQIFGSACYPGAPVCIASLLAVDFNGADAGVAVGNGGEIVTILSGSPTSVTSPTIVPLYGVSVPTAQTAYAVGFEGVILKGDLVGDVWVTQTSGTPYNLHDVCFVSDLVGTAVGERGTILRTTDGGATWIPQVSGTDAFLSHVSFLDADHGVIKSEHALLKTNNGGATWVSEDLPTGAFLSGGQYGPYYGFYTLSGGIDYIDMTTVAAVGGHENILARRDVPVAILFQDLTAQVLHTGSVRIQWAVMADEVIQEFHVYRSDMQSRVFTFVSDRLASTERAYIDETVSPGMDYRYALAAVGEDGSKVLSRTIQVSVPSATTTLFQNDPNPFNPTTRIHFRLSRRMDVTLKVYDSAGHYIMTLLDENLAGGEQAAVWDGRNSAGTPVGSGVYFYKLQTEEGSLSRKMVLLQ